MRPFIFFLLCCTLLCCLACSKDYTYNCSATIAFQTRFEVVEATYESKGEADQFCSDLEMEHSSDPKFIEVQDDCMCEEVKK